MWFGQRRAGPMIVFLAAKRCFPNAVEPITLQRKRPGTIDRCANRSGVGENSLLRRTILSYYGAAFLVVVFTYRG